MSEELKPCPFCGSRAEVNYKIDLDSWIVECSNFCCPASYMIGWWYDTERDAIDGWNRRTERRTNGSDDIFE